MLLILACSFCFCQKSNFREIPSENISYEYLTIYNIPNEEEENEMIPAPFEIDSSEILRVVYNGEKSLLICQFDTNSIRIDTTNFYRAYNFREHNTVPFEDSYCKLFNTQRMDIQKEMKLYWPEKEIFAILNLNLIYPIIEIKVENSIEKYPKPENVRIVVDHYYE